MSIGAALTGVDRRGIPEVERMFREHHELVYRTAYSILKNAADAEDVLQTVFLRLVRREVTPILPGNVKGYFYRAAVNLSLDVVRSKRRYELVADAERFDVPVDSFESTNAERLHRRLTDALTKLNAEAVHLLLLRYAHGYSDKQIAELLGATRGAIAVRLLRARARLRTLMQGKGADV
jgi:RNA polymerase sigma-70 factor (ECF subfamily)